MARKRGRPSKLTPELREKAARLSLLGLTNVQIAASLDIGITTFDRYMEEDEEFRGSIKEGREDADGNVVQSLYARAMGGDTTAMIFWLKNRQPKHWRDKINQEHDGEVKININAPWRDNSP